MSANKSAMALTLTIENQTSLPDGGPLSVSLQGKRGIDIGRDQYLDWTLPDPSRGISGKHCEIRWHDSAYWLHDISTNGTFLDGADSRLKAPHRLCNGDRFAIGHYIILATLDGETAGANPAATPAAAPSYDEIWNPVGEVAPPIDPKQLKASRDLQPVKADFLEWAVDVPSSYIPAPSRAPAPPQPKSDVPADDMLWAQGAPKPPPPEPEVVPMPHPRRPVWVTGEPSGPWAAAPPAVQPAVPNAKAAAPAPPATGAASLTPSDRTAPERLAAPPRELRDTSAISADDAAARDFIRLVSRGAGLPEDALSARHPAELAEEIGQLMRLFTENTRQLLEARHQAKRLARSSDQTMVQALDNNPLKFTPTAEDAMRIMFGPPTRGYLDARRAFTQSFDNLKSHQVKTYSAMQYALKQLMAEFDPVAIEHTSQADRGLAGMVGSRKARLWDLYVARWQARTQSKEDGLLNAFMDYFAERYDDGK
jgi:type VI secretion system protein ImpI